MRTCPPSRANREIVRRICTRPTGSAPDRGSSRIKISGSCASACASFARCRGMRQRAKLAQALAHSPEILILDEPLSGADPVGRVHSLDTIARFAKAGGHVLMSTHVLYEIERLTRNIVLIHNGKAIASGDVHAIRALIDAHPHAVRLVTPAQRALA